MKDKIYYVADNKMYCLDAQSGTSREITSRLLESYKNNVRENARRNEWKNSGSGAIFMGETDKADSPEAAVQNINYKISALRRDESDIVYSMSIDTVSGIYTHSNETDTDGIVLSRNEYDYTGFDLNGSRVVLSEGRGVEAHLGVLEKGSTRCEILTEGESRECWPSWSRIKRDRIIYSGCGLAITRAEESHGASPFPHSGAPITRCIEGPYSVCSLDTDTMELRELVEDPSQKYSYIKPHESADGYLYYIKKPYREEFEKRGGCLDALLIPFRLISAIFGFLYFFTMKYSGKTLTNSKGNAKAKQRSEAQTFIDGNLINAEKEMERNQKSGDKFPGIIPRSYELCRRRGERGEEETVKKGVIAYSVTDSGEIFCSNGSHILRLAPNGRGGFDESVVIKERAVSFIHT